MWQLLACLGLASAVAMQAGHSLVSLPIGLQGGGRRDSSIVRIPEELVEAGLIKQYEKLPFQVRSFVWLGSWHSGP